jgi:hypothetical protein
LAPVVASYGSCFAPPFRGFRLPFLSPDKQAAGPLGIPYESLARGKPARLHDEASADESRAVRRRLALKSPALELRDATSMQDLLMLAYTALFFTLAFLYVAACRRLK